VQEITIPKQPSIADKIVELPPNTVVVVKPRLDDFRPDRPWDFIHRTGLTGWLATRGASNRTGYLDEKAVRLLIEDHLFHERRFFVLYQGGNDADEGWVR